MKSNIEGLAEDLKLRYLADNHQDFFSQCSPNHLIAVEVVERLLSIEISERQNRSLINRLKKSKIGRYRHINEFDWLWPKKIDELLVKKLMDLEFVDKQENVILLGPQGVGKSMIAKNFAYAAICVGRSALVTSASEIVTELAAAKSVGNYKARLQKYLSPHLLVIDEIGYLSFDQKAADLLFEVVSKRYETGSIVLTTNLHFQDWGQIFPGANSIIALIDRITHHSHIITIDAESYRLKESKKSQLDSTNPKKGERHGSAKRKN